MRNTGEKSEMNRKRSALTLFYQKRRVPLPPPLIPSKSKPYLNSMSPAYPYLPIPSVSSSGGCSGMSEGSVLSVDQSKQKFCQIAPSAYHVEFNPPAQTVISVDGSDESDSASHTSNSDNGDDESIAVDVERVESYSNFNSTSVSSQTSNNAASSSSGISDSCPPSAHSLISSEPQVRL